MAAAHALYLGIDLSTQSVTGILLDSSLAVAGPTMSVNFDSSFPEFRTRAGMQVRSGGVVTSPVRMWLRALDALMDKLGSTGLLPRVAAVSISGQQHGSVYWTTAGMHALGLFQSSGGSGFSFAGALGEDCFALADSPIWADSSTGPEVAAFDALLPGGPAALAAVTGSRAYARFSGPQIAAVAHRTPSAWAQTAAVSLVSSFAASLFLGSLAPIDASDACGTNLIDLATRQWHPLLVASIPGLTEARLGGPPCAPASVLGRVAAAVCGRWGLPSDCAVIAATGDNASALSGLGVCTPGDLVLSLGTSDTLLGVQRAAAATPQQEGHVMILPTDAEKSVFAMLCYANGGDVRRRVRDELCGGDWAAFDAAVRQTSPANNGLLGLHLDLPEITPVISRTGDFYFCPADATPGHVDFGAAGDILGPCAAAELPAAAQVRAVVEGRLLSMRARAGALGLGAARRVLATGGGTGSSALLQVAADVFNCEVMLAPEPDAAAVGAARRAAHGLALARGGDASLLSFGEFLSACRRGSAGRGAAAGSGEGGGGERGGERGGGGGGGGEAGGGEAGHVWHASSAVQGLVVAARPRADAAIVYSDELIAKFRRFEDGLAAGGGRERVRGGCDGLEEDVG